MKIAVISDLHGRLPLVPSCDLLLLGGDLLPDRDQKEWLMDDFRPWLGSLQAEKTFFIAGNHDFYFQQSEWREGSLRDCFKRSGAEYLEDNEVVYKGMKIWGTPWVQNLPTWAFNVSAEVAERKFSRIPKDTDIVLSHAPAQGVLDAVGSRKAGSRQLLHRMQEVSPRFVFCGHIHECGGQREVVGETRFCNVSYLDENYIPKNTPLLLEV